MYLTQLASLSWTVYLPGFSLDTHVSCSTELAYMITEPSKSQSCRVGLQPGDPGKLVCTSPVKWSRPWLHPKSLSMGSSSPSILLPSVQPPFPLTEIPYGFPRKVLHCRIATWIQVEENLLGKINMEDYS